MKLTVVITKGEEMLIGQVREAPGVVTQGKNVDEIIHNIQDALQLYFQDSDGILEANNSQPDFQNVILTQELEFA
ncbi:type II toxin-antitoxin system HicB family antitoxin [Dyadobacter sp. OTU695]|uniref:type II toxin-antitoxin system HicB family antitoxin n=1 Tax=Dyadobacter sp. OTU695 TaxID=3043860 RepID=UPI00313F0C2E